MQRKGFKSRLPSSVAGFLAVTRVTILETGRRPAPDEGQTNLDSHRAWQDRVKLPGFLPLSLEDVILNSIPWVVWKQEMGQVFGATSKILLANASRRAANDGPTPCYSCGRPTCSPRLLALGFILSQFQSLQSLGNEPVDGRCLSFSIAPSSLSAYLSKK